MEGNTWPRHKMPNSGSSLPALNLRLIVSHFDILKGQPKSLRYNFEGILKTEMRPFAERLTKVRKADS